jgi:hypothetical protein
VSAAKPPVDPQRLARQVAQERAARRRAEQVAATLKRRNAELRRALIKLVAEKRAQAEGRGVSP